MILIFLPLLVGVLGLIVYLAAGILLWLGERVLRGARGAGWTGQTV